MSTKNKYLSPSRLIGWLFPEKYKDIPQWVLEQAAEEGKDYHALFEAYINGAEENDIKELIVSEKQERIFNSFKKWYDGIEKSQNIKSEYHAIKENFKLHGFIDLIDFDNEKFYDFKLRNLDQELDITTDILQMIFYEIILTENENWDWELIYFDKKTGAIKKFSSKELNEKMVREYWDLLDYAIDTYQMKNEVEAMIWNKKKTLKI